MSAVMAMGRPPRIWLAEVAAGEGIATRLLLFRWLVIVCQLTTIAFTWPLWQTHLSPPMLPAVPLPAVDLGLPLLFASLVIIYAPRMGLIAYSLLVLYAIAIDQTRLQPEIISLLILLWGTLPSPAARGIARVHLVALWFFSGFNKMLSPAFFTAMAPYLLSALTPEHAERFGMAFGAVLASTEVALGLFCLIPRTRKLAAWIACILHLGILATLSPLGHDHNSAVWPWNIALAFAGFAYIAPWREPPIASWRGLPRWAQAATVFLLLMPFGFYFGKIDAYLAHNLYSANIARAVVKCPVACQQKQDLVNVWLSFNVPMPPEHRLFEQYFALTCQPGDQMAIVDSRWWYQRQGLGTRMFLCEAGP